MADSVSSQGARERKGAGNEGEETVAQGAGQEALLILGRRRGQNGEALLLF